MTKQPEKPNQTPTPDRWLAFCILVGKMALAGVFWLNWFVLTWGLLLEWIPLTLPSAALWVLFLAGAVVVSAW